MPDLDLLRAELASDPLGRGYSAMSDTEVSTDLNSAARTRQRTIVAGREILEAIVPSEWALLSPIERDRVSLIISVGEVNLRGANTRAALAAAFAAGSTTRSNLVALQTEPISRADELGLGVVKTGHVQDARR